MAGRLTPGTGSQIIMGAWGSYSRVQYNRCLIFGLWPTIGPSKGKTFGYPGSTVMLVLQDVVQPVLPPQGLSRLMPHLFSVSTSCRLRLLRRDETSRPALKMNDRTLSDQQNRWIFD